MFFLEATNLHKTYRLGRRNEVYALRGVDMSIESGEMKIIGIDTSNIRNNPKRNV